MIMKDFAWLCFIFLPSMLCYETENLKDIEKSVQCSSLRLGQYLCLNAQIDPFTQQPIGCTSNGIAKVSCLVVDGLICEETGNRTFERSVPCKWTNGYSYSTALLLSVFLGVVGADRFYLGHVGMGVLKFCTLGFLFIGQLVDIILIATQYILPKDGSNYIVGYYGPAVDTIRSNNTTYVAPRIDWFS
jgi:TM2 domain-containing membrane protein YozV